MKAIFDVRPDSPYDDSIERYQFPDGYLAVAFASVGDCTQRRRGWMAIKDEDAEGG